jgi:flagellar biosynthesis protein FlhF
MMDIRTYRARTLQEALEMVRSELGPDASILETRTRPRGIMRWLRAAESVEVVASNTIRVPSRLGPASQADREGTRAGESEGRDSWVREEESCLSGPGFRAVDEGPSLVADLCQEHATSSGLGTSELACQLVNLLSQQGIPNPQLQQLLHQVDLLARPGDNLRQLHGQLADRLAEQIRVSGPLQPGSRQKSTVAVVGPSGTGKTMNLAKLAAQFQLQQTCQVGLITADTSRLTSVDQLRAYAEMFQLPLAVVASAREMRRARQQFEDCELVLVDTAGIRPGDHAAMKSLRSLLGAAGSDEIMLVLNANGSQDSMLEAVEGFGEVGITSLMLTKFDEATRLGQLLPVLHQSHLPVSYVSDGQGIPQDLQPAQPHWLARRLLGCSTE